MKFWAVRAGSVLLALGACFGLQQWADSALSGYMVSLVVLSGIYVTLAVSLNLINGITGQFSIGHAAFFMLGAYTCAFATERFFAHQPLDSLAWILVMAVAAAVVAGLAGLLVGLPSLRLRGDYLAIVTLGFGEIIRVVVQNVPALGGSYGITVNLVPRVPSVMLSWLLAIGCIALCRNLLKTSHGLPFLAVREDEVASSAMGVQVTRVKVTAFVVGSMLAGMAGAVYAPFQQFMGPTNFDMYQSFIVLTMVVLGGTGSITGAAVAGLLLYLLPEYLRLLKNPATGKALTMSGNVVAAGILSVIVLVWLLRKVQSKHLPAGRSRYAANLGALAAAGAFGALASLAFKSVPFLSGRSYAMADLRMAIFSLVLIALMLLRPQGLFGHREFSWDGLAAYFRRRRQGVA